MPDLFFESVIDRANGLMDLLNDGRKKPFNFNGLAYYEGFYVFSVKNDEDTLFNVIDQYGEIPENMSVNWRCFSHIVQDLNLKF